MNKKIFKGKMTKGPENINYKPTKPAEPSELSTEGRSPMNGRRHLQTARPVRGQHPRHRKNVYNSASKPNDPI